MALLEEQFTETLDAGAPDITYEGGEGREQQVAQALWDKLPPQVRMQFGSFQQFFSSGAWKQVLEMLQQQMQGRPEEIQETETIQEQVPQQGLASMMPAQMAYGGIAGLDGRRQYGIGSWFQKKIMDPIKKNWKPIAAIGAGLALDKWGIPTGRPAGEKNLGEGWLGNILGKGREILGKDNPVGKGTIGSGLGGLLTNPNFLIPAASMIAGTFAKPDEPGYTGQGTGLNITRRWENLQISLILKQRQASGVKILYLMLKQGNSHLPKCLKCYAATDAQDFSTPAAHGGRIRAQEGGLMDLGGMEKDYRNDGGFVPIGGEEKADDVPARLSRNEFVFTADAVRNAGGGDMDRGAEVMENVMKNLEGGGRISDESQGKGAGEMFEVSERLSEVV